VLHHDRVGNDGLAFDTVCLVEKESGKCCPAISRMDPNSRDFVAFDAERVLHDLAGTITVVAPGEATRHILSWIIRDRALYLLAGVRAPMEKNSHGQSLRNRLVRCDGEDPLGRSRLRVWRPTLI
jgi:hypothetical protein